jgi:hypothetical protein
MIIISIFGEITDGFKIDPEKCLEPMNKTRHDRLSFERAIRGPCLLIPSYNHAAAKPEIPSMKRCCSALSTWTPMRAMMSPSSVSPDGPRFFQVGMRM